MLLDLLEGALFVEAVGHGEVLGVVGDGDVLVAAGERGVGHLADGVAAVAGGGVHVHVAADVGERDDAGQRVCSGGFDFAQVLAHLGRHPVHAEGGVDLLFGGGGDG